MRLIKPLVFLRSKEDFNGVLEGFLNLFGALSWGGFLRSFEVFKDYKNGGPKFGSLIFLKNRNFYPTNLFVNAGQSRWKFFVIEIVFNQSLYV
jgi:hypothetical protein